MAARQPDQSTKKQVCATDIDRGKTHETGPGQHGPRSYLIPETAVDLSLPVFPGLLISTGTSLTTSLASKISTGVGTTLAMTRPELIWPTLSPCAVFSHFQCPPALSPYGAIVLPSSFVRLDFLQSYFMQVDVDPFLWSFNPAVGGYHDSLLSQR